MFISKDSFSFSMSKGDEKEEKVLIKSMIFIDSSNFYIPAKDKRLKVDLFLLRDLLSKDKTLSTADIQSDRFAAVNELHAMFGRSESCTVVLKGSGTLIFDGQVIKVCALGNAAMAAPGMGDVLSGIVIGLMAQNIAASDAAQLGVCLHAAAADLVIGGKTRGLLASDVVDALQKVMC